MRNITHELKKKASHQITKQYLLMTKIIAELKIRFKI